MNRKEAIAEYKNRKTPRGTYVVRFADDGPAWVDATPDLDAARNSTLFALRTGAHRNKQLQAEWNAHGGIGVPLRGAGELARRSGSDGVEGFAEG
jgi:hypothetical protein